MAKRTIGTASARGHASGVRTRGEGFGPCRADSTCNSIPGARRKRRIIVPVGAMALADCPTDAALTHLNPSPGVR